MTPQRDQSPLPHFCSSRRGASAAAVPPWPLFRVWLALGAQSFGGGGATLALIRREVVERRGWMTDAEFVRDWALCQVTPGINLLGLTILIGRRLGGVPGIALALVGLLAPSVAITILIKACYAHFQTLAAVRAAVRGVIPATVGLGLLTAYQMALPLLAGSRREGRSAYGIAWGLLGGAGLVVAVWQPPVVLVLCAAGALGAAAHWRRQALRARKNA